MGMKMISIEIDEELLNEAGRFTKIKKEAEIIEHALNELVKLHRRKKLDSLRREDMWEEEGGSRRRKG